MVKGLSYRTVVLKVGDGVPFMGVQLYFRGLAKSWVLSEWDIEAAFLGVASLIENSGTLISHGELAP